MTNATIFLEFIFWWRFYIFSFLMCSSSILPTNKKRYLSGHLQAPLAIHCLLVWRATKFVGESQIHGWLWWTSIKSSLMMRGTFGFMTHDLIITHLLPLIPIFPTAISISSKKSCQSIATSTYNWSLMLTCNTWFLLSLNSIAFMSS